MCNNDAKADHVTIIEECRLDACKDTVETWVEPLKAYCIESYEDFGEWEVCLRMVTNVLRWM